MEKVDFSKYAGSYSLSEAKEISKKMEADIFEAEKKEALADAKSKHGDGYTYELVKGTSPDLRKLSPNQRVCAGIKGHHILMTRVPQPAFVKDKETPVTYEYGVMSGRFSLVATDKLTAYAVMCIHYNQNAPLIIIYSPESSKEDSWTSFDGKIAERLDEIFGGVDSFDKYIESNKEKVKACYKTIKRIV